MGVAKKPEIHADSPLITKFAKETNAMIKCIQKIVFGVTIAAAKKNAVSPIRITHKVWFRSDPVPFMWMMMNVSLILIKVSQISR